MNVDGSLISRWRRKEQGFTLAELLIVIAIIMILAGFGFVAVISNQRRLKLKETDEIAREIFVAAQNYLTAAWADGDLYAQPIGSEFYGDTDEKKIVYRAMSCFGHRGGAEENSEILPKLLLPFGSIDEHVRSDGSYVVVYDIDQAVVSHVFYSEYGKGIASDKSGVMNLINATISDNFKNEQGIGAQSREERIAFARASDNAVDGKANYIGYYGADKQVIEKSTETLERPSIKVHNGENLWVDIIDPNKGNVTVTLAGLQSGESVSSSLNKVNYDDSGSLGQFYYSVKTHNSTNSVIYTILLDSVTEGRDRHFAAQFSGASVTGQKARFDSKLNNPSIGFLPGENITVGVTVTSTTTRSQIESTSTVFNSLFDGQLQANTDSTYTALISNGRHLQNLSKSVSGIDNRIISDTEKLVISGAKLQRNVIWGQGRPYVTYNYGEDTFWGRVHADRGIFKSSSSGSSLLNSSPEDKVSFLNGTSAETGCFASIDANYSVLDSKNSLTFRSDSTFSDISVEPDDSQTVYRLLDFNISDSIAAGLFGEVSESRNLSVTNVLMINPSVRAGGSESNAGAFVGKNGGSLILKNCGTYVDAPADRFVRNNNSDSFDDVITSSETESYTAEDLLERIPMIASESYRNGEYDASTASDSAPRRRIYAENGTAGGLVGFSSGVLTVENSLASVPVVAASGIAGGLIGKTTGTVAPVIKDCYSGGHTEDGLYNETIYNITAVSGVAGGLIGSAGNADISNSYSTCSVFGSTTAGGFVGEASGSIQNCYCTGLVSGVGDNAFIGGGTPSYPAKNYYFEIINEKETSEGITYKGSGETGGSTGKKVEAFDKDAGTYNTFVGGPTDDPIAMPYDTALILYYSHKYALRSMKQLKNIEQLNSNISENVLVMTHYGDWPAPEVFVINTVGSTT